MNVRTQPWTFKMDFSCDDEINFFYRGNKASSQMCLKNTFSLPKCSFLRSLYRDIAVQCYYSHMEKQKMYFFKVVILDHSRWFPLHVVTC